MTSQAKKAAKTAFWGIVLLVGALWFWHALVGNPLDDLALIRRAHIAPGFIVDTWEDAESGDEGGTHWFHGALYTFRLPDGREITQRTRDGSGRLKARFRDLTHPVPIEVEYIPDNPTVSRIKGSGSPTVFDWLWRKLALIGLLLALLLAPGYSMLRSVIKEWR